MLKTTVKLNSCTNLLYHWLVIHAQGNQALTFNCEAFQVWTSEFLPQPVTKDEVIEAIVNLKNLNLIKVENKEIRINFQERNNLLYINKLPVYFLLSQKNSSLGSWFWGLFILICLISLWGGCFWLSLRLSQLSPSSLIPTTPYSVLAEKVDR
jgi:hypothetical protein